MNDSVRCTYTTFIRGVEARVAEQRIKPAETVLWIHGYTLDATSWDAVWRLLPEWNHIGIDLPGHGRSQALGMDWTLQSLGSALAQEAVGRNVTHVVGLSLGSVFALEIVLSELQAFRTLTMAAPAFGGGPVEAAVGLRFLHLREVYRQRGRGGWMTELWMRSPPETFAHAPPEIASELARLIDRHSWSEFERPDFGIAGFANQPQRIELLPATTARVMIVIGEKELDAFRRTAQILTSIHASTQLVELAGVGHLCLLQAPEAGARLLRAHWRGNHH